MRQVLNCPSITVAPYDAAHVYSAAGKKLIVSYPALISTDDTYLHFASMRRNSAGQLRMTAYLGPDAFEAKPRTRVLWSNNGGGTWPVQDDILPYDITRAVVAPSDGRLIAISEYLTPGPAGSVQSKYFSQYNIRGLWPAVSTVNVTGFPALTLPDPNYYGAIWSDVVQALDGSWLLMAYVMLDGETAYTLYCLKLSADFQTMAVRSVVAPSTWHPVPSIEGPTEAGLVRNNDGSLACVFRNGTDTNCSVVTSTDDGLTWSEIAMTTLGVLDPTLKKLDDGTLLATTGYAPVGNHDMFLHLSADNGATWMLGYNILTHHNTYAPVSPLALSTGYVAFERLDDQHFLVAYDDDRNPAPQACELWCQRITIQ